MHDFFSDHKKILSLSRKAGMLAHGYKHFCASQFPIGLNKLIISVSKLKATLEGGSYYVEVHLLLPQPMVTLILVTINIFDFALFLSPR